MALDWENMANYSNQIYPFEQLQFQNHNELLFSSETELLCFDSAPPTLFDIDDILVDPATQKRDHLYQEDHYCNYHGLIPPNTCDINSSPFPCLDFPPPLFLPTEENFPFEEDYFSQFLPCSKKQKLTLPCFYEFVPEFVPEPAVIPQWSEFVDGKMNRENEVTTMENNANYHHHYVNHGEVDNNNYNDGNGNGNGVVKEKSVSAQSKAARERRRRITEKTQELGKLVPGGTKMNTAEMLQAAFKYVKFLQAQLGILESMKTIKEEGENTISLKNLSILASDVVQEKLFAKEKCLVPLDFLPMIEQHLDFSEINIIL